MLTAHTVQNSESNVCFCICRLFLFFDELLLVGSACAPTAGRRFFRRTCIKILCCKLSWMPASLPRERISDAKDDEREAKMVSCMHVRPHCAHFAMARIELLACQAKHARPATIFENRVPHGLIIKFRPKHMHYGHKVRTFESWASSVKTAGSYVMFCSHRLRSTQLS
jgi:hypothetical protein